jgi:spore germination protein GerM
MRTLRSLLACVVLGTAGLAACGIPVDDQTRDIVDNRSTTSIAAGNSSTVPQEAKARLFFVSSASTSRPDRLQTVARQTELSLPSVLKELLKGPTTEEGRTVKSAIPLETRVIDVTQSPEGLAEINLSATFLNVNGDQLVRAVAQLVYTASAVTGVTQVRLVVDGTPRDWPRGDGTRLSRTLTIADFAELSPSSQPDYVAIPSR